MPWGLVLDQLQAIYVKANDPDKVLAAGDQLLALDPDDPEAAVQCLKAAETKKDTALIKKYSAATSAAARKMAAVPEPKDAGEVAAWKGEVDYAKQVDTYAEYSLYRVALESRDPKVVIEFASLLRERNPKGDYAAKVVRPLFIAYLQSGDTAKAIALAETVLATDQSNEEMLLAVADSYLQQKKEPEKVHAYSAKDRRAGGPETQAGGHERCGLDRPQEPGNRKREVPGRQALLQRSQFRQEADVALRAALPLVDAAMKPEVLYLLGFANYKLDKPQEAANYYRECAAIKSPYQATAAKNLLGLKNQYHGIK